MKKKGCKSNIDPTTKAKVKILKDLQLTERQIANTLNIAPSSVNNIVHNKKNSNDLPYSESKDTTAIIKKEYEQLKDDILQTIIECLNNNKQLLLTTKLTPVQYCMLTDKFLLLSGLSSSITKNNSSTLVNLILNNNAITKEIKSIDTNSIVTDNVKDKTTD